MLLVLQGAESDPPSVKALKLMGASITKDAEGKIVEVNLSYTHVTNAGLRHLEGLTSLKMLYLANTQVTNQGVLYLDGLSGLERIYVNQNQIDQTGVKYLQQKLPNCKVHYVADLVSILELKAIGAKLVRDSMGRVVHINLNDTENSNTCLRHLEAMTSLHTLEVGNTNITGAGLAQLKTLTNLERLNLYKIEIEDAHLLDLQVLPSLKVLDLSNTGITDLGVGHLKGLTGLEQRYLDNLKITDAVIEDLKGLTSLQDLWLVETRISAAGVAQLRLALPECKISWDKTDVKRSDRNQVVHRFYQKLPE